MVVPSSKTIEQRAVHLVTWYGLRSPPTVFSTNSTLIAARITWLCCQMTGTSRGSWPILAVSPAARGLSPVGVGPRLRVRRSPVAPWAVSLERAVTMRSSINRPSRPGESRTVSIMALLICSARGVHGHIAYLGPLAGASGGMPRPVQDQATTFDVVRALSDRRRRGLPAPQALCPAGTAPPPPASGGGGAAAPPHGVAAQSQAWP